MVLTSMTEPYVTSRYVPHVGWLDFFAGDDVDTFLSEGWFEYKEQAFLWLYLRPGDIFLDGGAHVGLYSVLAGRILQGAGHILAIEPVPQTTRLLRRNLKCNNIENAKVIEEALYSHDGKLPFHIMPPGKAAYDSLYVSDPVGHDIQVVSSTLDVLLERERINRVDFMKLDIEGAEIDALSGALHSIAAEKIPLVMVEFTELNLRSAGHSTEDLRSKLEAAGYELFRFDTDTLTLKEFVFDGPVWYENLFAVRDISVINDRLNSASDENMRIAMDVISRGCVAKRVKDQCVQQENQVASLEQARIRLTQEVATLEEALEQAREHLTSLDELRQLREKEQTDFDASHEELRKLYEIEKAALIDELDAIKGRLVEERVISLERLLLLRRAHLQHMLAEKRIDQELLCRWPLRLAFKYKLAKPPLWAALRHKQEGWVDDVVARHIAEHSYVTESTTSARDVVPHRPAISIILCTYNPKPELLAWALESIAKQSMPPSHYEIILVDNNSHVRKSIFRHTRSHK
jgi:FkbM family methyltransferase